MYRPDIELFRVISSFGIVWFHSHLIGSDFGYAGLVYFIILSLYLSGFRNNQSKRIRRLLIPWLFWSMFYGLTNILIDKPFIDMSNGLFAAIITGTMIHLWYLPFIFIILLIFDIIKKNFLPKTIGYWAALISLFLFLTVSLWRNVTISFGTPWAQYFHALPAVFTGAFFWAFSELDNKLRKIIMLSLLIASFTNILSLEAGIGISYTLGILPFIMIVQTRPLVNIHWNIHKLSDLTLGIYLIQIFIFLIIFKFKLDLNYFLPFAVFTISTVVIWFSKKFFPKITKYIM